MRRFATAILAAMLVAGAQTRDDAERMLKAAQNTELVDGNLNAAIKQYGAIVAKFAKSDRGAAATALVLMADCYRKMGNAESRKIYEQVVRDYGDQKDAVATARARLGRVEGAGRMTSALVWSGPKVDTDGAISPDGRYLSAVDWDTGDLVLHEIATGQDRRLTDTKQKKVGRQNVYAEESAISRDGKQVAYGWYDENNGKRYELRLANATGDPNPHRLYDNPAVAWLGPKDWSPDGKWVSAQIDLEDGSKQIALVSVPDGSLRVLKAGKWRGEGRMFFSPDGKYLGYDLPQGDAGPERDVFVMAIDGAREIPAVVHRSHDIMMGWSPDGEHLLFASDRTGALGLWSLPFADGKPQGAPELIKAELGEAESMGVTRSGALYYGISVGSTGSSVQIASFDFATGKLLSPPRDVSQDYLESTGEPWWSPDGKYLAYLSRRGRASAANSFLVIRSTENGRVVRELKPKLVGYDLWGWAPDGRSFLVRAKDSEGRTGAFRIDAQTEDISPLVLNTPNQPPLRYPVWSLDGKSIYFSRTFPDRKEAAFFQRDLASGVEKELIRRPLLGDLNLSPDGKYLFTASVDPSTNSRTMLLIPTGGGEPRDVIRVASEVEPAELTNWAKGQGVMGVTWAPDSRSFLVFRRNAEELWEVPVDGGAAHKFEETLPRGIGWFRMHPDGRQIVFAVRDRGPGRREEVWVLENFLPTASAKK